MAKNPTQNKTKNKQQNTKKPISKIKKQMTN